LEEPKKGSGSRDISDLKARLGLKKGAAQPVPNTTPQAGVPVGGAPAPTPAAPQAAGQPQRPLPAPPGFAAPQAPAPAAPPPPDPRRDPFAAAAPPPQAAYYGYAPLPGTDDGTAAAPIDKPKPWGRIITFMLVGAVALGGGYICGRSCAGRENYNMTITQAGDINTEVEKMAKKLTVINDRINQSKDAAAGNPDVQLASDLGTLDLTDPDTQKIFHTNYFFLDDLAIDRLFTYYNDNIRLFRLIKDNAKKTEQDADAINNFVKNGGARGADKRYGIIMDMSGAVPLAHFVELGTLVCPKEGQTDCAGDVAKFKYRMDAGGAWGEKPLKGKPGDIVTPLKPEGLFTSVMSGNPDMLAARDHVRRMGEIRGLSQKIFNEQKELVADLKRASDKPKVFTF
jgi:hypothetical protein